MDRTHQIEKEALLPIYVTSYILWHWIQPIQCMTVKHEEHFLNLHGSLNIVLRCYPPQTYYPGDFFSKIPMSNFERFWLLQCIVTSGFNVISGHSRCLKIRIRDGILVELQPIKKMLIFTDIWCIGKPMCRLWYGLGRIAYRFIDFFPVRIKDLYRFLGTQGPGINLYGYKSV